MFKKVLIVLALIGFITVGANMVGATTQFLSFYGPNSQCFMTMENYYGNNTMPLWICSGMEVKPVIVVGKFTVYFDFDSATIKEDQIPVLEKALAHIKKFKSEKITLAAFCDFRGSDAYNERLGKRRLESVQSWLIENGAPDSLILVNNGKYKSPIRKLVNKFCSKCREDRRVVVEVK